MIDLNPLIDAAHVKLERRESEFAQGFRKLHEALERLRRMPAILAEAKLAARAINDAEYDLTGDCEACADIEEALTPEEEDL
jgi:hypothetical protein